jgi:hypothetical protein
VLDGGADEFVEQQQGVVEANRRHVAGNSMAPMIKPVTQQAAGHAGCRARRGYSSVGLCRLVNCRCTVGGTAS